MVCPEVFWELLNACRRFDFRETGFQLSSRLLLSLDEAYTQDTDLLNNDPFDHLEVEVTVKREGYAYIFVSNEHPSQLDVSLR